MKLVRVIAAIIFACMHILSFGQGSLTRLALVIGVKNYEHIPPLQNTLNDVQDMASTLKQKGFEVVELYDPKTKREMQESIVSYFRLLQDNPNSAGMVFYSGHGMQVDGVNYLIPTTANPKIKADLDDQCMNMDYVMRAIEQAGNPLNIFVLDACRNNPFRGFTRSTDQGLSMVSTPKGSYIVFATKPGSVASDGDGSNGLFTSKLLKYLNAEGLNIEQVFKKVAADVALESNDSQRPWIASDYTGDFYFTPGNGVATDQHAQGNPVVMVAASPKTSVSWDTAFGYENSGNTKIVDMSEQQWISRNLNVDQFANGTKIMEARTEDEWRNATKNGLPAWCYLNNDPANGPIYGKLYNWFAVSDPRKVCPTGWRVPTDEDWTRLSEIVGAGSATKLKSMDQWAAGKNGSDALSFAALPAGSRSFQGKFSALGEQANWWSSTEEGSNIHWAYYRNVSTKAPELFRTFIAKGSGLSVRCVKE